MSCRRQAGPVNHGQHGPDPIAAYHEREKRRHAEESFWLRVSLIVGTTIFLALALFGCVPPSGDPSGFTGDHAQYPQRPTIETHAPKLKRKDPRRRLPDVRLSVDALDLLAKDPSPPISPLTWGSTGADVVIWQQALIEAGYGKALGRYGADGKYFGGTWTATSQWQRDNGLPSDGLVDEDDIAAMFSAEVASSPDLATEGVSAEETGARTPAETTIDEELPLPEPEPEPEPEPSPDAVIDSFETPKDWTAWLKDLRAAGMTYAQIAKHVHEQAGKTQREGSQQDVREVVESLIGLHEIGGNNEGLEVRTILAVAGIEMSAPWCVSMPFFAHVVAGVSVDDLPSGPAWTPSWTRKAYYRRDRDKSSKLARQGESMDVATTYHYRLGRAAHGFLIEKIEGPWVYTIEGNASPDRGNLARENFDGRDGIVRKRRRLKDIYSAGRFWYSPGQIEQRKREAAEIERRIQKKQKEQEATKAEEPKGGRKLFVRLTGFSRNEPTSDHWTRQGVKSTSKVFHTRARADAAYPGDWVYYRGLYRADLLKPGEAGADPDTIPYGSVVVLSNGETYTITDTGSGAWYKTASRKAGKTPAQRNAPVIDLYFPTYAEQNAYFEANELWQTVTVYPPEPDA